MIESVQVAWERRGTRAVRLPVRRLLGWLRRRTARIWANTERAVDDLCAVMDLLIRALVGDE